MRFKDLIKKANQIYLENFPAEVCFERAVFFSWYCKIRDCQFCYMSTGERSERARRSLASLLGEVLLVKKLGWEFGFFSGGVGAFEREDFREILEKVHKVYGKKIWINIGVLEEGLLREYKPFIKGVVASIETVNPEIHKRVCPSKPVEPYERMLEKALELKLKTAMTMIIGLGEKKEDFGLLKEFIEKNKIEKIHIYGLNPQRGTVFEKVKPPSAEEQAWWIAQTRIGFPRMDIQAGIWRDRVDYVGLLLKAGANSLSKFPVLRYFGGEEAREIERQSELGGRRFKGSLSRLPEVDWEREIKELNLDDELKNKIKIKLNQYLNKINKRNINKI